MSDTAFDTIRSIKERLGDDLAILAHHYQVDEVYRHADLTGDSLELARHIPNLSARHIVFCGVTFMAETAAILSSSRQRVTIPDPSADCVMAEMAPDELVEEVVRKLSEGGRKIIPLAYVNTSAAVKAVCGRMGGSVCTSANARTMLEWALGEGDGVLFLPDKNLGNNTADKLGIKPDERMLLDVSGFARGVDAAQTHGKKLFLWPGRCIIHHRFKPAMIEAARAAHPGCEVIVHPECSPEVVGMADDSGSTSRIIRYVADAPEGAVIYVGTEISMVRRLARQYAGRKTVIALCESQCANMAKITEERLAALLSNLDGAEPVVVPAEVAEPARLALTRMLEVCAR